MAKKKMTLEYYRNKSTEIRLMIEGYRLDSQRKQAMIIANEQEITKLNMELTKLNYEFSQMEGEL